jgi:hypothetical protein
MSRACCGGLPLDLQITIRSIEVMPVDRCRKVENAKKGMKDAPTEWGNKDLTHSMARSRLGTHHRSEVEQENQDAQQCHVFRMLAPTRQTCNTHRQSSIYHSKEASTQRFPALLIATDKTAADKVDEDSGKPIFLFVQQRWGAVRDGWEVWLLELTARVYKMLCRLWLHYTFVENLRAHAHAGTLNKRHTSRKRSLSHLLRRVLAFSWRV